MLLNKCYVLECASAAPPARAPRWADVDTSYSAASLSSTEKSHKAEVSG